MQNNIPEQIKNIANSPEIFDASEKIGKDFDLHIDQIGQLDAAIRQILRGFSYSKDFTKNIKIALEVDEKTAIEITKRVNTDVLQTIRDQLKSDLKNNQNSNTAISDLEHIGDFTIEPENGSNDSNDKEPLESHDEMIAGIENPESIKPKTSVNNTNTETMLVDHLLSSPSVTVEQKTIVKKPLIVPRKPKGPSGPDPYRESVK